jgi:hypothetical protein
MKKLLFLFALIACKALSAQQLHWTPVAEGLYSNSTTIIAVVQIDNVEQYSDQMELGVFCNDECRGTNWTTEFLTHRYTAEVNVKGENGHQLTFKAFDHRTNQELVMDPLVIVSFTEEGAGNHMNPLVLNFTTPTTTNTTSGDWSNPDIWGGSVPTPEANVVLGANVTIGNGSATSVTVANLTIPNGITLTIERGSALVVTGDMVNSTATGLVIEDGAQVISTSDGVLATANKSITGYSKSSGGWYAIASSVNNMAISGSSFLTPEYDLYRYNETSLNNQEWENYKDSNISGFTAFENGRGYLYAHSSNLTPSFSGTLNSTDVTYGMTYTDRTDGLSGFNLIGNPFPHNIYKGKGGAIDDEHLASGFYTLTNANAWELHTYEDAILPGQGILVKTSTAETLTIAKNTSAATAESGSSKSISGRLDLILASTDNEDRAFVYFGQGIGLEKMGAFSDQVPSLWIHTQGGNYAIAHVDNTCETLDLYFQNKLNADFTFTVKAKDTNFSYLQLVDNLTGTVVDLLKQPEVNFHANGNEPNDRFRLVFKVMTGVDEEETQAPFAYINNGQLILSGVEDDSMLQIIDMTGRTVLRKNGTTNVSIAEMAHGVYILRLVTNNNVKSQKIVIQ